MYMRTGFVQSKGLETPCTFENYNLNCEEQESQYTPNWEKSSV